MEDDSVRPSPGLNMEHGFMRRIEHNQHIREQQIKDDASKRLEVAKMARKVGMPMKTTKPTMEIYRPPSLRGPNDTNQSFSTRSFGTSPTMVAEAPPFVPIAATASMPTCLPNGGNNNDSIYIGNNGSSVQASGNASDASAAAATTNFATTNLPKANASSIVRSTSTATVVQPSARHTSKVHFQLQVPPTSPSSSAHTNSSFGLKRSKSLGAGDVKMSIANEYDLGGFGMEVQAMIRKALDDPNKLSTRHLMELVRRIFNRVIDNSRYAEPAARLSFAIVEKERTETFLETMLNSCREFYNERDRCLRNLSSMSGDGHTGEFGGSINTHHWIAYVTFMYEMYARLKTRQRSAANTGRSALTAGPMLLSLLGECCHVILSPPSLFNASQIECLFFVLTSIGRDVENEMPQRMKQLMAAVRDGFTNPSIIPFISKTLLQLIELQASNWQLTTPAVTYYYPGSQERK